MAFAPMIATVGIIEANDAVRRLNAPGGPLAGMNQAERHSQLADWERNAFSRRLAAMRAGSHCKGCGAPLHLTNEGACEYCGLRP